MPSLKQSLEGKDLGHIRIVAELWGVEIQAQDALDGIKQISPALLDSELVRDIFEALPESAQNAVRDLQSERGRLGWSLFARKYGKVRKIGPARRDKEAVHRDPQSTSELLWYRGLIARDFFDGRGGPQEFAYIPEDLLSLLPLAKQETTDVFGRPARPAERKEVIAASDRILDEACTLLASLRMGMDETAVEEAEYWRTPPTMLMGLLRSAGILDAEDKPNPEAVRQFLEAERGEAMKQLVSAWLSSENFNELRLLPGLRVEGKWKNDALQSRHFLLGILRALPEGNWWNLASLVADIKERRADFQRPSGDYDSWYLVEEESGDYLRGFEHWDRVDGELIAFLVRGPLHWLGILDLGAAESGEDGISFRFNGWAKDLLSGRTPNGLGEEGDKLNVDSQGQIQASRSVPRAVRYQVARFCSWEEPKKGLYRYRLEAASLQRAKFAGLDISQLLKLLKSQASTDIAPNLLQALKRWEKEGTQAKMKEMIVLRLTSAGMLKALRASRAARYLGEPLGPNAIEVKAGARQQVMRVLTELGYLGEFQDEES
jgi:hypothetical protein